MLGYVTLSCVKLCCDVLCDVELGYYVALWCV